VKDNRCKFRLIRYALMSQVS